MRDRKGFSPLEVIIAVAILAIGIMGTFKLFPIALRQVQIAHERTLISEMADARLGHLRTAGGRVLLQEWERGLKDARFFTHQGIDDDGTTIPIPDDGAGDGDGQDGDGDDPPSLASVRIPTETYAQRVYSKYSTHVQRVGPNVGVRGLQRASFTVEMPDGRVERFVTYVVEP